ncbi:ThiF family adenylyltransferase [Streptomyces sp. NPDC050418]|uniref:ThiF family adenylyltransferase n=1 Tax=Streptomyces sp. NPDC050418 TaxID=3365612 RepID=UPI003794F53E
MHPRLKTSLLRAWRDLTTLQYGVTPAHARTLGPVGPAVLALFGLLDGTRGLPLLRTEGARLGLADGQVDALLGRLAASGLLDDATLGAGDPAVAALRAGPAGEGRLAPELAALSLRDARPGGGPIRLVARRERWVQVRGAGRVGAQVAALLAGSGVGRVDVVDSGFVQPVDVTPGGLPEAAVGERRSEAARRLVRQCAPGLPPRSRTRRPRLGTSRPPGRRDAVRRAVVPGPALVVLTPRDGLAAYAPDPVEAEQLMASGTPHLYAGVVESTGFAGPLVLPGATACAGCVQRRRIEGDSAWPRLLAQWRSGRAPGVPAAGELVLTAAVAGLTAAHALALLDGETSAAAGRRWELTMPGLVWRAEPLGAHPRCSCGARTRNGGRTGANTDTPSEAQAAQGTMTEQPIA